MNQPATTATCYPCLGCVSCGGALPLLLEGCSVWWGPCTQEDAPRYLQKKAYLRYLQLELDLALSALIWPTFLSMALPEAQVAPQWV
jgi:hypothetical protein